MKLFLSAIKDQVNILSLLMAFFLLACLLYKLKKRRLAVILLACDAVIFLLVSTAYLPQYLAEKLERQYAPFSATLQAGKERIYIHVLGSGYSLDSALPATARLGLTAQGRLAEGIRLYRQIDNSILVTSAGSLKDRETQAEVAKKAAILLGVDSNRIATLTTPNTTQEEVAAMATLAGKNATVIVVTDAIHIPRAMKFFTKTGMVPLAAPTNFRMHKEVMGFSIKWWPSIGNITLMDIVLHEFLGNIKAGL